MLFQHFAIICVRSSLWHKISIQEEDPEAPGVRSEGELWGMQRTGLSRDKTWGLGWYSKDRAGQEGCLYVEGGKWNLKPVSGWDTPRQGLWEKQSQPEPWAAPVPGRVGDLGATGLRNTALHWSGHQRFLKMCQGSILQTRRDEWLHMQLLRPSFARESSGANWQNVQGLNLFL